MSVLYNYFASRLHGCDLFSQPAIFCFGYSERHANTVACGCSLDLWGSILSLLLLTDSCPFGIYFCNRFTLFSAFYILALYCLLRTGSPCHLAGNSGSPPRGSVCGCLFLCLRQVISPQKRQAEKGSQSTPALSVRVVLMLTFCKL